MSRVYDSARWKALRARHLHLFPLCQPCQRANRITIANTVDHRIAMSEGGPAYPDHDGLEAMCVPCHSRKTARGGEHGAVQTDRIIQGGDASGWPTDPAHPWNKAGGGARESQTGATKRPPPFPNCCANTGKARR